jgi:nitroimidazol reductase NimA-like FMN-containing flavoprotein (pyridoxamine 5'-phosphate oxidase superfamily)
MATIERTPRADAGSRSSVAVPPTDRVRLRRKPERGRYARATIDAILDEAIVASVGWVLDGQPYVTPVNTWRHGDRLYWHASAGSRMVRVASRGEPVCVTVALVDGLVMARSATNHSLNYRSVMVLGRPTLVGDEHDKAEALDALIDHLAPGRAGDLRPVTAEELRKTAVLWIGLDEASAKIRAGGAIDEPGDLDWPAWAGVIPVSLVSGTPQPEPGSIGRAPAALGGSIGRRRPPRSTTPR